MLHIKTNLAKAAFDHVMQKFHSREKLVEALLIAWSQTNKKRNMKIEISRYKDGTQFSFDEGLLIQFYEQDCLQSIYHWNHYSFNASDAYYKLFEDIDKIRSTDEFSLYFSGVCEGHVL